MEKHFFVGVDGGATKTMVRIEDENGHLIGEKLTGPASIRLSVTQAWQTITQCITQILTQHNTHQNVVLHVGIGLAGCEIKTAYRDFINFPHSFADLCVTSDSHTACLAAHQGQDGAIIIVGTGTVGYQIENNKITQVAGWGFPHDDEGSGAWIGLQGIRHTLKCLDGRSASSTISEKIFNFFNKDKDALLSWVNEATPAAFALLAPIIIELAQQKDFYAVNILKNAANAIEEISISLKSKQVRQQSLPCAVIGGIAPFLVPFLSTDLQRRLQKPKASPEVGAIYLIRQHVSQRKEKLWNE